MIHRFAQRRTDTLAAHRLEQCRNVAARPRHLFQLTAALAEFEQRFQFSQSAISRGVVVLRRGR